MQDPGSELLRIHLPRTRVNRAKTAFASALVLRRLTTTDRLPSSPIALSSQRRHTVTRFGARVHYLPIRRPVQCDELPAIRAVAQSHPEDAGFAEYLNLAVGLVCGARATARIATGPGDERADAVLRVRIVVGVYASQALVAMVVAVEDHLGTVFVEDLPEGLHSGLESAGAGSVERMVHVSQGAPSRMLSKVVAKPLGLGRLASEAHIGAVAVKGHYVPASEVVAVVALALRQSRRWYRGGRQLEAVLCTEVVEVGFRFQSGVRRVEVFVVARRRHSPPLELTPPGRAGGIVAGTEGETIIVVAVGELWAGAVSVGVVPKGDHPSPVKRR